MTLIFPLLTILLGVLLPFVSWPEMLNWPFFIGSGWMPYRDIAIVHTPLLPVVISYLYQLFGTTPLVLKSFGIILLMTCSVLVGLTLFLRKVSTGKIVISQFIFLLLVFAFEGNTVWFESLLAPIFLLLFLLQTKFLERETMANLFLQGLLFGLSLTVKQTSLYILPAVLLPVLISFLSHRREFRRTVLEIAVLFFATLIPVCLMLGLLWYAGIINDFWMWGVYFISQKPFEAVGQNSYLLSPTIKQAMVVVVLFGFSIVCFAKQRKNTFLLLAAWIGFSYLFSTPRFAFFHLVPFVCFFSLLVGFSEIPKKVVISLIAFCLIMFVLLVRSYLTFDHSFLDKQTIALAEEIENRYPDKSVFLLNAPEQVYFLTHKLPGVRPSLPQLAWYFEFYRPIRFLDDIKRSDPQIIVYSPYFEKARDGVGAYRPFGVLEYLEDSYLVAATASGGVLIYQKR